MRWKMGVAGLWMLAVIGLWGCAQKPPVVVKTGPTAAEIAAQEAAQAAQAAEAAAAAKVAELAAIADEAYLYAYPLITGEVLRLQMSNVAKAEPGRAPLNSFAHARRPAPDGGERPMLMPDGDTLTSTAWLDLGREPMVFSYPAMGKRWFSFSLHSQSMSALATLGSGGAAGTAAGKAGSMLVSGPGWQGTVPKGMRHVRSPARYVVILGRIQANGGDADVRTVNALQARLRIAPLPARGKAPAAPAPVVEPLSGVNLGDPPRQAIETMDTAVYFNLMARLLGASATPAADDAPRLARMARIGLEPGKPFDLAALDPAVQAALNGTGKRAAARMSAQRPSLFSPVNGWWLPIAGVDLPADELTRATMAAYGWPGPLPQEWIEASAQVDAAGKTLNGGSDYTLSFAKGQLPPADAFWSSAVYSEENGRRSVVPNSADRFSLGPRDKLLFDADGSLTLHVQNLSPGYERAANWLPAPKGDFVLVMRLYSPRDKAPSILPIGKGSWSPPPARKAD